MTGDDTTATTHRVRWAICAWRRMCTICGCSIGFGFGLLFAAFGASASPKVPADLAKPGDELAVGENSTGESCRLRLEFQRGQGQKQQVWQLYCRGWEQPSGTMLRRRLRNQADPEKLIADASHYGHSWNQAENNIQ